MDIKYCCALLLRLSLYVTCIVVGFVRLRANLLRGETCNQCWLLWWSSHFLLPAFNSLYTHARTPTVLTLPVVLKKLTTCRILSYAGMYVCFGFTLWQVLLPPSEFRGAHLVGCAGSSASWLQILTDYCTLFASHHLTGSADFRNYLQYYSHHWFPLHGSQIRPSFVSIAGLAALSNFSFALACAFLQTYQL